MNRRAFITGLLTAPMIVRATSLDALPRGVALTGFGVNNHIRQIGGSAMWFLVEMDGELYREEVVHNAVTLPAGSVIRGMGFDEWSNIPRWEYP